MTETTSLQLDKAQSAETSPTSKQDPKQAAMETKVEDLYFRKSLKECFAINTLSIDLCVDFGGSSGTLELLAFVFSYACKAEK